MLRHRIQYLFLLLLSCLAAVWLGQAPLLLLPAFFLLLPLFTGLSLLLARKRASLSLEAAADAYGSVQLRYTARCSSPWPVARLTWRAVLSRSTGGPAQRWTGSAALAGAGQEQVVSLRVRGARTGYLSLSTDRVFLWDALGLFRLSCAAPPVQEVLIAPKLAQVHLLNDQAQFGLYDSAVYSQHRPGQDVSELFALHEYVPGEELRRVHWKLSSKLDKLVVREFGLPVGQPVTVLLETQAREGVSSGDALSTCFDAAASLAARLLRSEISFDLAWMDGDALHRQVIEGWNTLEQELPALLRAQMGQSDMSALSCWLSDPQRGQCRVLYYIAGQPDTLALDELAREGGMEVHLALAGNEPLTGANVAALAVLDPWEPLDEFTI